MIRSEKIKAALSPEQGRQSMAARQVGVMIMVLMLALGGLTACGKRGDPYRPSEVPADSADSNS